MALTAFQKEILSLLARNRSPDSFFAGGATLNRERPRQSQDFDIEHVAAAAVERSFEQDRRALQQAGYAVRLHDTTRPASGFARAAVEGSSGRTLIDWTWDSAVRFFPVVEDPDFGWRLHDVDLAINKVLAMAGRREPRDYHDVVSLIRVDVPLAALAWAACGKDAGMTPDLILDELTRHSRYSPDELAADIVTDDPVDPVALKADLHRAVGEARDLFATLPLDQAGLLYLTPSNDIAPPDPEAVRAGRLRLHSPSVGGSVPSLATSGGLATRL